MSTPLLTSSPAASSISRVVRVGAWPLAVTLVIHAIAVLAVEGSPTDDFTTVYSAIRRFLDGVPVYNEVYHHVDPHYLYNPGATLLLAPLGMITNFTLARGLFILANAAGIIASLAILTRLVGHKLSGALFPLSIVVAFCTEAVRSTLVFSNINGLLLLALVGFYWLWLSNRRGAAGLVLGLAIVIKPMFAPVAVIPIVQRCWKTPLMAALVPAVLNLVAWPIIPGAQGYLTEVAPYLKITRDYANVSLPGLTTYFATPPVVFWSLAVVVAVSVILGGLALLRLMRIDDFTWLVTTTTLVLTGVYLLSSLGQQYYSLMLIPALFTALRPSSAFHTTPAWLAAVMFLAPLDWATHEWPTLGRWFTLFLPTMGWLMLVVTIAAWAISRPKASDKLHPPHTDKKVIAHD
ncbi:glycosyltransferase family 87 protein [Corynebacterium tapiri]|uniref:glycosyltransferase family 87 protein n=1 Tax=Corynebacterium tapiri TaxID=1448266 RepID=UPI001FE746F5|nr:glycosyltransferase family 87 protein [Corynebacterium tapiri]